MTHTLHRSGPFLNEDFVWLMYQAKGINDENIKPKALAFLEAAEECHSENWGDVKSGNILELSPEEIRSRISDKSRLRGVFTSREQVTKFLKIIKEKDLGISVVISGLLDEVLPAVKEAGLTPHTINFSLGVWGKKELLPSEDVLAVTTMCGHHMVSPRLVERLVKDIKRGRTTPEKAALRLAKLCPCGIFNQVRAEKLLRKMAEE
ncbi:MAG TPA: hypothetical protein GXX30_10085 [Firmicutes bacterium]|nr:hypothetical protein [Candidatus Fermentithermobacillaceae bacterium]